MRKKEAAPLYLGRILGRDHVPVGTCFQVEPGVLVTAAHVLTRLGHTEVPRTVFVDQLAEPGDIIVATVVEIDTIHDLAVLKTPTPFRESVKGFLASDHVRSQTPLTVTANGEIRDVHGYRFVTTTAWWEGAAAREVPPDAAPRPTQTVLLARISTKDALLGMSGAPVRRASDDRVVGVQSARYNSADGWFRDTAWVVRTEDLAALSPAIRLPQVDPLVVRKSSLAVAAVAMATLVIAAFIVMWQPVVTPGRAIGLPASPSNAGDVPAVPAKPPYSLSVLTNTDIITFEDGVTRPRNSYYFDKPIADIPSPPPGSSNCTGKHVWARSNGGQDAYSTAGQFTLSSNGPTINILQARIDIVDVLTPSTGLFVSCESGSPIETRIVSISLNTDSPTIEYYPEGVARPPAPFAFTIAEDQQETFQFNAHSINGSVSWKIVLLVTIDGEQAEVTVDDHGMPFVTYSDFEGGEVYIWDGGSWLHLSGG